MSIIARLSHKRVFIAFGHSCASLLLANGIQMKAIQEWLGHSTFQVTADFYSHLDFHSKIDSANKIADVLSGKDKEKASEPEKKPKSKKTSSK